MIGIGDGDGEAETRNPSATAVRGGPDRTILELKSSYTLLMAGPPPQSPHPTIAVRYLFPPGQRADASVPPKDGRVRNRRWLAAACCALDGLDASARQTLHGHRATQQVSRPFVEPQELQRTQRVQDLQGVINHPSLDISLFRQLAWPTTPALSGSGTTARVAVRPVRSVGAVAGGEGVSRGLRAHPPFSFSCPATFPFLREDRSTHATSLFSHHQVHLCTEGPSCTCHRRAARKQCCTVYRPWASSSLVLFLFTGPPMLRHYLPSRSATPSLGGRSGCLFREWAGIVNTMSKGRSVDTVEEAGEDVTVHLHTLHFKR